MPGFYAREFLRGGAVAYVGYSETLHYAIDQRVNDCGPSASCLKAEDIKVRRLPTMLPGRERVGLRWVDGLALAANLPEEKQALALEFIRDAVSDEAYRMAFEPRWPYVPRYLLPARRMVP